MRNYYNEVDPFCAAWLRNLMARRLIPKGDVDERPIEEVARSDLAGYAQHHFFAGIGGWSLALKFANWPDDRPVWTGSCPCQPFSLAGQKGGFNDSRHLWPVWRDLISECRPPKIFGEEVASATYWLAVVRSDLEALGYAVGAMPIEAACVGANHKRDRIWVLADSEHIRRHPVQVKSRSSVGMETSQGPSGTVQSKRPGGRPRGAQSMATEAWWQRDGSRQAEPRVGRVADGLSPRVGEMCAFGNAIVPQVAAEFIKAAM